MADLAATGKTAQLKRHGSGLVARFILCLAAVTLVLAEASAQEGSSLSAFIQSQLEDIAAQILPEETTDGNSNTQALPLPNPTIRKILQRGALTGLLELCGKDWAEVSYLPFMQATRGSGRFSEEDMAFIGVTHGFAQGYILSQMPTRRAELCTADRIQIYQTMALDTSIQ